MPIQDHEEAREPLEGLLRALEPVSPPTGLTWLREAIAGLGDPARARVRLAAAFAGAARRLGTRPLPAQTAPGTLATADELGRAVLLLAALERRPEAEHGALVAELFLKGEERERRAILRALPLLPEPGRFLTLAREASRTNSLHEFEAIACENPYPAQHFPETAFNQLVLKAIFLGVSVRRIQGLAERTNPELRRMARDTASERRAAGRPVPEDLDRILGEGGSRP